MKHTPKDIAAAHEAHKNRMRILTMRNDSSELHAAGAQALESGPANAARMMRKMEHMDGPKRKAKVREKAKTRTKSKSRGEPEMSM